MGVRAGRFQDQLAAGHAGRNGKGARLDPVRDDLVGDTAEEALDPVDDQVAGADAADLRAPMAVRH